METGFQSCMSFESNTCFCVSYAWILGVRFYQIKPLFQEFSWEHIDKIEEPLELLKVKTISS